VNIAARVCSLAKAGEVLVTDTVRALTRTVLDVSYEPVGTRQLKGVAEPIAIFRVVPLAPGASRGGRVVPGRARARWVRGRTRPRWAASRSLAAIAVVSAAAAALATAALLPGTNVDPGPSATASASLTVAGGSASPSDLPSDVPSASASAGLSPLEAELRDRIPSSIKGSCAATPASERTPKTIASLLCSPDPASADADRVWYEAFDPASRSALSPAFFEIVNEHAIPHGDCVRSPPAWGDWSLPGAYAGQRLCYTDRDGHAWVDWTYDVLRILVRAERLDGDRGALFKWSDTIAQLLN
jgi:hypothetical protein